ncbi:type 3 dihydrofolate reductase [Bacillus daqingensis]|uniref:Dihydrofolate reductase n=1 Tax=Bacillus daqingensis TaxID=872396 RepID=A0ABV9NYD5_9BACI
MISMIAAMDRDRVIGKDGGMPWKLPGDLAFFKQTTLHKTVVMGRKTFESIGRPLPKRRNLVLTRNASFSHEGIETISDMNDILALAAEDEEIVIMGGAELYEMFLPYAARMYLTRIDASFEGDTFFPPFDEKEWAVTAEMNGQMDEKNQHPHTFQTLERVVEDGQNL